MILFRMLHSPLKAVFRFSQIATIVVLIVYFPFYDANYSFKSYINDKVFFFLFGMGLLLVLQCIIIVLSKENRKPFSFSWLDFAPLLYVIYITISKFLVAETEHLDLKSYQVVGLSMLYCIVRFLPVRYYTFLIGSMLLSGIIQAIYGCLQLYGVYPSEHHLFKITGSFFNPGPYAGYLSMIFSMAFAIYLFFQQVNFGTSTFLSTELLKKYVTPVVIKFKTLRSRLCNRYQWLQRMRLFRKDRFIVKSIFWKRLGSVLQRTFSKSNISQLFRIDRVVKLLSLITLVSILLVLPASKSRASWLAVLISSCYLMISFYPVRNRIGIILDALWKRMVAAMLACVILAASGFAVYSLKKDSADGRLLIWKVSTKMIQDQPVVGHGFNTFQAQYMDYQAAYFKDNPDSEEVYYADNITYPFNEYIKALGEQGVVGCMLLVSIVIILILLSRAKFDLYIIIAKVGILSLAVFAFFSYPTEILPIKVNAIILLAIAAQRSAANGIFKINLAGLGIKMVKTMKVVFPVISIVLLTIIYPPIKKLHKAYCNWDEAYLLYNFEDYKSSIDSYKSASEELSSDGEFLIMYGKSLAMAAEYREAIEILRQAEKYQRNTILYTALGDCHSNISDYENAESAYLKAHFMVPNRFYPKYLLAKMYQESGHIEKAKATARELLSKPVKVESTAIREIREEMKLLLQ